MALVVVLLSANLIECVRQTAVSVPYADQWSLLDLMWKGDGPWDWLTTQYATHRMGVFFPLSAWVLHWSQGDLRLESVLIASWLAIGAVVWAFYLWRSAGQRSYADLIALLWVLSLLQYETMTVINVWSHSIGPLVLILSALHILRVGTAWAKWAGLGLCGVALAFTGFGMFGASWLTAYGLLRSIQLRRAPERRWVWLGTAVMLAGWGLFFSDYNFTSAGTALGAGRHALSDYILFMARMVSMTMGFRGGTWEATWIGGALLGAAMLGCMVTSWRLWRGRPESDASVAASFLMGTGLVYILATAIGRIYLGTEAGMVSRYMSLTFLLLLGLYIYIRSWPAGGWRRVACALLAAHALYPYKDTIAGQAPFGFWGLPAKERAIVTEYRNAKLAWLLEYGRSRSIQEANRAANLDIILGEGMHPLLVDMLQRLQERRWHPFNEGGRPSGYEPLAGLPEVVYIGFHNDELGKRWMREEGRLWLRPSQAGWLNLEILSRAPLLPQDAPLVIEWEGRHGEYQALAGPRGVSMQIHQPMTGPLVLRSPAGTRRPGGDRPGADHREMSFLIGRVSCEDRPRYLPWYPLDSRTLGAPCSVLRVTGFHGWEAGFGWMDEAMEIVVRTAVPAWLNVQVEGRYHGLLPAGGLTVAANGGEEWEAPLREYAGAFSLPLREPGRYVLKLRSVAGAESPARKGDSSDTRRLSFRLKAWDVSEERRYNILGPSPEPAVK